MSWLSDIDHPFLLAALLLVSIPLYSLAARVVYPNTGWQGVVWSIQWWRRKDRRSFWEGHYIHDEHSEFRLFAFVVLCFAAVAAEYGAASWLLSQFHGVAARP